MTKRRALLSIATGMLGLLLCGAVLTASRGGLGWFCPHMLQYATQSEWRVFGGQVVVYRSRRVPREHALVEFLLREDYVARDESADRPRWQRVFHWNYSWRDGYSLLGRVLTRHADSLVVWSKDHPDAARVFWAEGFRLLRSEDRVDRVAGEYILHYARGDDAEELRAEIDRLHRGIRAAF